MIPLRLPSLHRQFVSTNFSPSFTGGEISEKLFSDWRTPETVTSETALKLTERQQLLLKHLCKIEQETIDSVAPELADVLVCLVDLVRHSATLDVDLVAAAHRKMQINAEKYPVEKVKGSSRKYDRY